MVIKQHLLNSKIFWWYSKMTGFKIQKSCGICKTYFLLQVQGQTHFMHIFFLLDGKSCGFSPTWVYFWVVNLRELVAKWWLRWPRVSSSAAFATAIGNSIEASPTDYASASAPVLWYFPRATHNPTIPWPMQLPPQSI